MLKCLLFFCVYLTVVGTEVTLDEAPACASIKRYEVERHLSTKTPYRVVANKEDTPLEYPGCKASRIWSVIRHGARNPSRKVILQAKEQLTQLKSRILQNRHVILCPEELEKLKGWSFNVSVEEEKFLVAEGEDELVDLAERMQGRFPNLLADIYDPDTYFFKYTATQRTLKSAKSFATGLFGRDRIGEIIYPEPLKKDPILRFYKLCNRWKTDVDKNPTSLDNVKKFLQEPVMIEAINYIRRRTQISNITAQEARLIYTICAFETAWNRRKSPSIWCSFFTKDTIKALEFAEDLEYYWIDGYGYNLTYEIACPAMADMFESINPSSSKPNATFYFTHSGTLLKLLAHLGLYKDKEHLTHRDINKNRSWKTSTIDAFATNVAFVLYECDKNEKKVLTLHQERVVRIPGCPRNSDLCSYETLLNIFDRSLKNCDLHEMCRK